MLYALTTLILDRAAQTTDGLFLAEPRRPVQKSGYQSQVKVSVEKGRESGSRARYKESQRSWRRERAQPPISSQTPAQHPLLDNGNNYSPFNKLSISTQTGKGADLQGGEHDRELYHVYMEVRVAFTRYKEEECWTYQTRHTIHKNQSWQARQFFYLHLNVVFS